MGGFQSGPCAIAWAAVLTSSSLGFLRPSAIDVVNQSTLHICKTVNRTGRPIHLTLFMKKFLSLLLGLFISISAFAWEYTAQCKMNDGVSYVVASQDANSNIVEVRGYGRAANSTVVITAVPQSNPSGTPYTYTVTLRDGYGKTTINSSWKIIKVENIVCN